jgi:TPP-dependent pyruvate/acetoin dehydrogenase alpha subunit
VLWRNTLTSQGLLNDDVLASIEKVVSGRVQAAVDAAEQGPWEPVENLLNDVYTPVP